MPVLQDINTPEALARVRSNFIRQGGAGGPRRDFLNGDGVLRYRFPAKAYYHAIRNHGADPKDDGYWEDMAKRYPECRVPYAKREDRVSLATAESRKQKAESCEHGSRGSMTRRAFLVPGGKLAAALAAGIAPGIPASRTQQ